MLCICNCLLILAKFCTTDNDMQKGLLLHSESLSQQSFGPLLEARASGWLHPRHQSRGEEIHVCKTEIIICGQRLCGLRSSWSLFALSKLDSGYEYILCKALRHPLQREFLFPVITTSRQRTQWNIFIYMCVCTYMNVCILLTETDA